MTTFKPSDLLLAQDGFFRDLCRLREAIATRHPMWLVTPSEIGVQRERKARAIDGGLTFKTIDKVHINNSLHYEKRAADLNLFVPAGDGRYRAVTDSDAPEWAEVHALWLTINPDNQVMPAHSADANHVSRGMPGDSRI